MDYLKTTPFYKIPIYCALTGLLFGIVEFAVNIYLYPWVLHNAEKFIPGLFVYLGCSVLVGVLLGLLYYAGRAQNDERLKVLKNDSFYLAVFFTVLTIFWLSWKVYDYLGSGMRNVSLTYSNIRVGLIFLSLIFGLFVYFLLRKKERPIEEYVALCTAWFTFVPLILFFNFEYKHSLLNNILILIGCVSIYFVLHYLLPRLSSAKRSAFGILILAVIFSWGWVKDYWLSQKQRQKISQKVVILNKEQLLKAKKPNIVIITPDALRADHLSCYGYENIKTRNIDKLAKQGVLFANCISQAPWTFPSFASIFTSLYPYSQRVQTSRNESKLYRINPNVVWLQEVIKELGYKTRAIVNNPSLAPSHGFGSGFDDYSNLQAAERLELKRAFLWKLVIHHKKREHQAKSRTQIITERVIEWLEDQLEQPFFLWVHYLNPHAPYQRYKRYFDFSAYHGTLLDKNGVLLDYSDDKAQNYSKEEQDVIKALYDEEILYVDENIGLLIQQLEKLNLIQNTLILLFSDHGDNFFDRSKQFAHHGDVMYNEVLHVPLILYFPGKLPSGIIKSAQVRAIDIMPTILDILGVKYEFTVQGESLLPIIKGNDNQNRIAYSEHNYEHDKQFKSYNTGEYKLIYAVDSEAMQLYDLVNDPYEKNNIIDEKPELGLELKNQMQALMDKSEELRQELMKGVEVDDKPLELDSHTKERLKALGYL